MPEIKNDKAIILFDGVCNLCTASVNFIIKHDTHNHFLFAPLQSNKGKELAEKYHLPKGDMDSFVLIENNKAYTKSSAALQLVKHLDRLYPLLYAFIIIPPFIRNAMYDYVSRNRYKWFGRRDTCMIPGEETKKKFIV